MSYSAEDEDEGSSRPRLSLQPRGVGADAPSPTATKASRPSPFGNARPREQVIAEREGKRETDVLKEQAKKEWKPNVVLSEAEREEKKAAEAELSFARNELANEEDPARVKILHEEVSMKEKRLEDLLASFEKMAVQSAQAGGARRPFDRRREDSSTPSLPVAYGAAYGGRDNGAYGGRDSGLNEEGFTNFKGRAKEGGERTASYGDTWSGIRGKPGQSQCYNCGEIGHFSRECPNASRGGSYGGTFGGGRGGRQCYTCGQEGHLSRECPQGGSGSRGGGYVGSPSYGGVFSGGYGGNYQGYDASGYGGDQAGGNGYDATGYGGGQGGGYVGRREYNGGQGDWQ